MYEDDEKFMVNPDPVASKLPLLEPDLEPVLDPVREPEADAAPLTL